MECKSVIYNLDNNLQIRSKPRRTDNILFSCISSSVTSRNVITSFLFNINYVIFVYFC